LFLITLTVLSGLHATELVMCTLQQKSSIVPDWKWRKHNAAVVIAVSHNFHAWIFSVFHSWHQFVSDVLFGDTSMPDFKLNVGQGHKFSDKCDWCPRLTVDEDFFLCIHS
jgi:hypothetical protein